MTFKIVARKCGTERYGYDWEVTVGNAGTLIFSESQWAAFRSLLMPSGKADFTIEEFDEKGNRL